MPKVTEKIDWISRFLFEHSLKLFWPRPSDLDRPRFWGVFAHRSWVTICRGPLVGSVHGNRRLNTRGGDHKLHMGFISWVKALMRWFKKYFKKSKFKVGTKLPQYLIHLTLVFELWTQNPNQGIAKASFLDTKSSKIRLITASKLN